MDKKVVVNDVYRHFKGSWYKVIAIAEHTETDENLVIYQDENDKVYARPYNMFIEEVPEEKVNPTGQKYRFMSFEELKSNEQKSATNIITIWRVAGNQETVVANTDGTPEEFTTIEEAIRHLEAAGYSDNEILSMEFRKNNAVAIPVSLYTLMQSRGLI